MMSSEIFNRLPDFEKSQIVFDAEKIDEVNDGFRSYSLFRIDNLYVEVTTSLDRKFRKQVKGYELKDLPLIYSGHVLEYMEKWMHWKFEAPG